MSVGARIRQIRLSKLEARKKKAQISHMFIQRAHMKQMLMWANLHLQCAGINPDEILRPDGVIFLNNQRPGKSGWMASLAKLWAKRRTHPCR